MPDAPITIQGDQRTQWGAWGVFVWQHGDVEYTAQIVKGGRAARDGEEATVPDSVGNTTDHILFDDRNDLEAEVAWRDNEVYPVRGDPCAVASFEGIVTKVENTWEQRGVRGCRVTAKRYDEAGGSPTPQPSSSSSFSSSTSPAPSSSESPSPSSSSPASSSSSESSAPSSSSPASSSSSSSSERSSSASSSASSSSSSAPSPSSSASPSSSSSSSSERSSSSSSSASPSSSSASSSSSVVFPEGLILHLDAAHLDLSDGDPVPAWPDRSGLGNDVAQPDETKRPVFAAIGGPNGKRTVNFSPGGKLLGVADNLSLDISTVTVFAVAALGSAFAGNDWIVAKNGSASGAALAWVFGFNKGGNYGKSTLSMSLDGSWGGDNFGNDARTAGFKIAAARFDGTAVAFWRDGLDDGGTTPSGAIDTSTGDLQIGGYNASFSGSEFFTGQLSELLIFTGALDDADVAAVNAYLAAKWGISPPSSSSSSSSSAP